MGQTKMDGCRLVHWAPGPIGTDSAAILLLILLYEADAATILLVILLYEAVNAGLVFKSEIYQGLGGKSGF